MIAVLYRQYNCFDRQVLHSWSSYTSEYQYRRVKTLNNEFMLLKFIVIGHSRKLSIPVRILKPSLLIAPTFILLFCKLYADPHTPHISANNWLTIHGRHWLQYGSSRTRGSLWTSTCPRKRSHFSFWNISSRTGSKSSETSLFVRRYGRKYSTVSRWVARRVLTKWSELYFAITQKYSAETRRRIFDFFATWTLRPSWGDRVDTTDSCHEDDGCVESFIFLDKDV